MKKIILISILYNYFIHGAYCQSNNSNLNDTLEFKTVITPFDTLKIEIGKKYIDYYDSCQVNFAQYWIYLDLNMTEKALSVNDELIKKYPYYDLPYNRHGTVLLNIMKDYYNAIKWYEIASNLNPNEGLYLNNIGLCYFHLKDATKAIEFFTSAIKINSTDAEYYYNRAYAKELNNDWDGAIEDYTKSIELDPKSDRSYNNLAYIYNKIGDYQKALEACNKALDINPEKSNAFYNRGISKYKLKDKKGACSDWKKASNLGTDASKLIQQYCE